MQTCICSNKQASVSMIEIQSGKGTGAPNTRKGRMPPIMRLQHALVLLAVLPYAGTMVVPCQTPRRIQLAVARSVTRPGAVGITCSQVNKAQPAAAPGKSSGDKKLRKSNSLAQQMKTVDAKLEGDASFFWQCVARHQSGGSVAGISGLVPVKRDARHLFGDSLPESTAIDFKSYDAIPVKRRGAGESESVIPSMQSFEELRSSMPPWAADNLLGSERMRYSAPTPIQKHTVPLALSGLDIMACAQTGSGKTTAFLLPLIASVAGGGTASSPSGQAQSRNTRIGQGLRLSRGDEAELRAKGTPAMPSALVLAPTRELAIQIELECAKLTFDAPAPPSGAAHWSSCAYGGATARPQLEALAAGVEILVATPVYIYIYMYI